MTMNIALDSRLVRGMEEVAALRPAAPADRGADDVSAPSLGGCALGGHVRRMAGAR